MAARKHTVITAAVKRKVVKLHGEGKSRNAIARELGIAFATVTKICQAAGLTFDRTATKAAVEARQIDNRARRVALIDRAYTRAEHLYARLEAPTYTYRVVYKDDTQVVTDDEPPATDERSLGSAIAGHLFAAGKLEQVDAGENTTATVSLLDTLAAGFAQAAAGYQPPKSP